jgi:phosphatidylinositol alpha-mannosyltransferase
VREIGRALTLPTNGSRARITLDFTRFGEVRRVLAQERFDVVHVHAPLTPALTWMALFSSRSVNVATFHAYRAGSAWYRALAPVFHPVVRRLDARIAVSEPAARFIAAYFPGDYTIIPNGIDIERFGPDQAWPKVGENGSPQILFVGRHDEPRKGLPDLLRALPSIRAAVPGCHLTVVGDGDVGRHADLLDGIGRDGVTFTGQVSAEDLPRYYASADLFCAPSTDNESFGIVLLEAMASDVPVVASDIPGYASVMTDGREGLLVPPRNPDALANAVIQLLSDPDLRAACAAAGRSTAASYAWPIVAARVIDLYERVIAGKL